MTEEPIDLNTTTVTSPLSELEVLRAKLVLAESDVANYKLRLADFENARKRLIRDAEVQKRYAIEGLAADLLPALDNLDRALAASTKAGTKDPLAAGVSATASQLIDALRRHGVIKIACPAGAPFDPNFHEAVTQVPTNDYEPGRVVEVLQQGFMLHDKVLRPAGVIVASEPPAGGNSE